MIDYIRDTAEYVKTRDGQISASQMLEKFLFTGEDQYGLIEKLSGGEKRRLNLLRVLMEAPNVLILDEPTRGIDIGTKVEIQKLVLKLASEGMSVTFISSETDEMLRTCSRLIVMRDRKKVGELSGEELSQSSIMDTIAGGDKE